MKKALEKRLWLPVNGNAPRNPTAKNMVKTETKISRNERLIIFFQIFVSCSDLKEGKYMETLVHQSLMEHPCNTVSTKIDVFIAKE